VGEPNRSRGTHPVDAAATVKLSHEKSQNAVSGSDLPAGLSAGIAAGLSGNLRNRFRILALLGRGGMGEVYCAEDLTLGRRVALKAIRSDRRLSTEFRDRFLREARLLSRFEHPGICRIYDVIESTDHDYLVLELIEGHTLCRVGDQLSEKDRLDVARQIAVVLEAAHAEGIVHRDLKPDNIMLTPVGQAKVLDFGLARDVGTPVRERPLQPTEGVSTAGPVTESEDTIDMRPGDTSCGFVMGTPAYLSPEQAAGEPPSPASDMYSFGLVLQRLFTGRKPYEDSEDVQEILEQARHAHTRRVSGIDRDMARLIGSLTTRTPDLRPTATEARRRIAWIQSKPVRRLRRWAVAAGIALVLAGAGKYMFDLRHERGIAQRHRAEAEGLVEFMLGDLRERLEPVGRLDVLDEVGDRALAYFAARSADERTEADHHRFARAMNQIGEVRLNQGDLDAARDAFLKARTAAANLVEQDPKQGDWLLALGASEFWLGNVAYLEGDLDGAEAAFGSYREVSEQLVALDSTNEDWQREVGYAYTNLAALHEAREQVDPALAALDESIRIKRFLVDAAREDPGRRSDLINALAWQANILLMVGDPQAAHSRYADGVDEVRTLIDLDPGDMSHKYLLSVLLHSQAAALEQRGLDDGIDELYAASLDLSRMLADHDSSNAVWREGLTDSYLAVGRRLLWKGHPDAATEPLDQARRLAESLTVIDPQNPDYVDLLVDADCLLARVAVANGDPTAARRGSGRASEMARSGYSHNPGDRRSIESFAKALVLAGEIEKRFGNAQAADSAWREAYGVMQPIGGSSRSRAIREIWLRVLTYRGLKEEAGRIAESLHATGFARPDFTEFCREHELSTVADTTAP
jgi:tetratricopeptide (TPR) repeat protein